ncbi:hypothetical protein [Streptomyces sp. SPB78]|uniref:hypothetical protein n=1 Tax=Streptomyces sp. (strain SPB78) TaxID=591157 RepID=UPI001F3BA608|nr:hypothetical protein [Streptomyces sp. SPB78]
MTTNFPEAVDEAFLSRADLLVRTGLPGEDVVPLIVADSLRELAAQWPGLRALARGRGDPPGPSRSGSRAWTGPASARRCTRRSRNGLRSRVSRNCSACGTC